MKTRPSDGTRQLSCLAAGLLLLAAPALAASGWTESYAKAQAEAKKTGKVILADFTGSDWCSWCTKLANEVFKTPEFNKWAADNVVLLYLDFPHGKAQPAALKRQNQQLAQQYGIRGYPTVLFLTADGAVVGRSGYRAGGAQAWIASVQPILDGAPKPEKVEPLTSLTDAQAAAAEKKLPLLVLACSGKSRTGFKPVLDDNGFAQFVKGRLVVVQVDTDAGAAETPNGKALAELQANLKARKSPTGILLIDAAGEKLLYSAYAVLSADVLMARLMGVLPKPEYDGTWLEDFDKAKQLAAGLNRPILMDFAGSDWCQWCIKLDKEVLSTPAFKKLAQQKVVLLKVDLPRQKQLPPELLKQNQGLAQRYRVQGFPTLLMADASGAEKSRLSGFPRGGLADVANWMIAAAK